MTSIHRNLVVFVLIGLFFFSAVLDNRTEFELEDERNGLIESEDSSIEQLQQTPMPVLDFDFIGNGTEPFSNGQDIVFLQERALPKSPDSQIDLIVRFKNGSEANYGGFYVSPLGIDTDYAYVLDYQTISSISLENGSKTFIHTYSQAYHWRQSSLHSGKLALSPQSMENGIPRVALQVLDLTSSEQLILFETDLGNHTNYPLIGLYNDEVTIVNHTISSSGSDRITTYNLSHGNEYWFSVSPILEENSSVERTNFMRTNEMLVFQEGAYLRIFTVDGVELDHIEIQQELGDITNLDLSCPNVVSFIQGSDLTLISLQNPEAVYRHSNSFRHFSSISGKECVWMSSSKNLSNTNGEGLVEDELHRITYVPEPITVIESDQIRFSTSNLDGDPSAGLIGIIEQVAAAERPLTTGLHQPLTVEIDEHQDSNIEDIELTLSNGERLHLGVPQPVEANDEGMLRVEYDYEFVFNELYALYLEAGEDISFSQRLQQICEIYQVPFVTSLIIDGVNWLEGRWNKTIEIEDVSMFDPCSPLISVSNELLEVELSRHSVTTVEWYAALVESDEAPVDDSWLLRSGDEAFTLSADLDLTIIGIGAIKLDLFTGVEARFSEWIDLDACSIALNQTLMLHIRDGVITDALDCIIPVNITEVDDQEEAENATSENDTVDGTPFLESDDDADSGDDGTENEPKGEDASRIGSILAASNLNPMLVAILVILIAIAAISLALLRPS